MIPRGLTIKTIWLDEHILEFQIQAANDSFSGSTTCYAALDEAKRLAEFIAGFPKSSTDSREYQLGDPDALRIGSAHLKFTCSDGSGHLAVTATIRGESNDLGVQGVSLAFRTLPAQIDSFVNDLLSMKAVEGDQAFLSHAI